MNILVTGGAGFIASQVADAYIAAGHNVTIVDNCSSGKQENINPKATFIQEDIRDESMRELFARTSFDIINHHAAQMDVRKSVEDPSFDASVNILGTLNLLENCKRTGVKKVIFASTGGAIYGEQDYFPADEQHPVRPLSPYGISKLAIEKYLFYYKQVFGIDHVILRYANVYGPRQNPHGEAGVVAIFSTKLLAGAQPVINGDGLQTRDYVFVGDVVRANVKALDLKESETINIGTGVETNVNDLFELIKKHSGSNLPAAHAEAKKGEQLRSVLTAAKAKQLFGWTPQMNLDQGIKETVAYFRNAKSSHGR
ncbi:MAG TPA: NAD-dependent epimerase/dehydratase family protein [Bacteroidota bacterium]|nr:NAD-dependent epimerase/dehydratase family protein [Bacteroidota bacterium]